MQCVILAGGLGTRMWPVAQTVPKTLLPGRRPAVRRLAARLAGRGRRHLGRLLHRLPRRAGARPRRRRLARGGSTVRLRRRGRAAARHRRRAPAGPRRRACWPSGSWCSTATPGCRSTLRRCTRPPSASGLPALMTVYENNGRFDASNVEYAEGRVLRYEKGLDPLPPEMRWIDYGLSVLDPRPGRRAGPAGHRRRPRRAVHRAGRRGRAGRLPGDRAVLRDRLAARAGRGHRRCLAGRG